MRTVRVRDVGEYEEVVWFASVPDMAGSHCVTHEGHAADADWIAIERPRIPPRPQAPAMLWGWLVDDADSAAEPTLRDLDEGRGKYEPPLPIQRRDLGNAQAFRVTIRKTG